MIYTFYSYKGGVGRSMALVNIAELMAQVGLNVLMVDWDLEAPGLEHFYPDKVDDILENPGVIDMLLDYKDELEQLRPTLDEQLPFAVCDVDGYVMELREATQNKGRILFLSAALIINFNKLFCTAGP